MPCPLPSSLLDWSQLESVELRSNLAERIPQWTPTIESIPTHTQTQNSIRMSLSTGVCWVGVNSSELICDAPFLRLLPQSIFETSTRQPTQTRQDN